MCGRPGARRATVRASRVWIPGRAWASFVAAEMVASSVITLALPEAHVSGDMGREALPADDVPVPDLTRRDERNRTPATQLPVTYRCPCMESFVLLLLRVGSACCAEASLIGGGAERQFPHENSPHTLVIRESGNGCRLRCRMPLVK